MAHILLRLPHSGSTLHCECSLDNQELVPNLCEEDTGSSQVCPGGERWPVDAAANETERGEDEHSSRFSRNCSQSRDPSKTY